MTVLLSYVQEAYSRHVPRNTETNVVRIVQQLNDKFGPNRALYDKSMKLDTSMLDTLRVVLKTGGILDFYRGGHFPRWPPVSKIGQYVNHKSHVQSIIVDIALVNNT